MHKPTQQLTEIRLNCHVGCLKTSHLSDIFSLGIAQQACQQALELGDGSVKFRFQNWSLFTMYPLVICDIAMERSTIEMVGKIWKKYEKLTSFHSYVTLPEDMIQTPSLRECPFYVENHRKTIGNLYLFMGFYGIYPRVIKHGVLENGPLSSEFPIRSSIDRGFSSQPCLIAGGEVNRYKLILSLFAMENKLQ